MIDTTRRVVSIRIPVIIDLSPNSSSCYADLGRLKAMGVTVSAVQSYERTSSGLLSCRSPFMFTLASFGPSTDVGNWLIRTTVMLPGTFAGDGYARISALCAYIRTTLTYNHAG